MVEQGGVDTSTCGKVEVKTCDLKWRQAKGFNHKSLELVELSTTPVRDLQRIRTSPHECAYNIHILIKKNKTP
ncbi:MAG: hypothetical protein Sylvanvirus19_17 [Sylvanvirus sp.]|uniref:Uncharacterized protein n=1 Tax=Sylvanvirus sp. TaxID=2487774 RepID=A0A3G5AJQ0_9VIRU|nr:MAG: hypothetical protein Sylvanvirus19_17 [Sylvanvirus sp.]